MSKRLFAILSLVLIASFILPACGGGAGGGTIKIGLLAPLSGAGTHLRYFHQRRHRDGRERME